MNAMTLHKREQEIIQHQWNLVRVVIPELADAKLLRPYETDFPEKNNLYKNYCEALRSDLIKGNYRVFRKPDVASSLDGIGKLARTFSDVEAGCMRGTGAFTFSRNTLEGGDFGFDGGRWLYRLTNGFAVISFDLPTETYWVDYEFDRCSMGRGLPTWPRKGNGTEFSRTDVVGMTLIERGARSLVGMEYLEVHGNADGYNRGEYAGALQPVETKSPRPSEVPTKVVIKEGKISIEWGPPSALPEPPEPPDRFLGAFIAPPPWDGIFPELQKEPPGEPMHNEPCLWKLKN